MIQLDYLVSLRSGDLSLLSSRRGENLRGGLKRRGGLLRIGESGLRQPAIFRGGDRCLGRKDGLRDFRRIPG